METTNILGIYIIKFDMCASTHIRPTSTGPYARIRQVHILDKTYSTRPLKHPFFNSNYSNFAEKLTILQDGYREVFGGVAGQPQTEVLVGVLGYDRL